VHIVTAGSARIRNKDTGTLHEFNALLLDWDTVSGDEEQMGTRTQWEAQLEDDELGVLTWTLWEYPPGALEFIDHDMNGHELVRDFDIAIEHDPEDSNTDDERSGVEWAHLPLAEQVDQIVEWFNTYFEDPQNEMPYADKDSDDNYQYPWGGPYDAAEQIGDEFSGKATDEAIQAAVEQVTSEGTFDWAPTSQHPDRQAADRDYYDYPDDLTDSAGPSDDEFEVVELEGIGEIRVPHQLTGPLMTVEHDGRIAREPSLPQPWIASMERRSRESAHTATIEALDDFEANFPGHNHPALGRTIMRLRTALGSSPVDIDVVRLGVAAERVKEYALRADDIFVAEMAAEVVALNRNLERNLTQFEEWQAYIYGLSSDPAPSNESIEAAQRIVAAFIDADALAPDVRNEIEAEIIPLTMPLEGEHGTAVERKTFMRSVRNIVVTACSSVVKLAATVGGKFGDGALDGVKAIGKFSVLGGFFGGVTYLGVLAAIHPSFAFLAPLIPFLKEVAAKAFGG